MVQKKHFLFIFLVWKILKDESMWEITESISDKLEESITFSVLTTRGKYWLR
jgi:hypothetical protein